MWERDVHPSLTWLSVWSGSGDRHRDANIRTSMASDYSLSQMAQRPFDRSGFGHSQQLLGQEVSAGREWSLVRLCVARHVPRRSENLLFHRNFFFFNSWECARKPQKCRNLIYQPVNCGQWNVSQGWGHMNQTQRTMKKPKGLPTYITKRAKGGWVLAAFGQKQRQTMWEVKFYKRKLLSDHRHWDEGS